MDCQATGQEGILRVNRGRTYPIMTKGGNQMKEEEIIAKLKDSSKEGKIPCAVAFKISQENGISIRKVGELCNQVKIKIIQCQLGCF